MRTNILSAIDVIYIYIFFYTYTIQNPSAELRLSGTLLVLIDRIDIPHSKSLQFYSSIKIVTGKYDYDEFYRLSYNTIEK